MQSLYWWKHVSEEIRKARHLSKHDINRAGLLLRDSISRTTDTDDAFDIIGAFRTLHSFALREAYETLEKRTKELDEHAIVSLRLKRIPAIRTKLCRPENRNMKLATMQDIGGCRAVLNNIEDVHRLAQQYGTVRRDYIALPKPDGYRSIHIVEPHDGFPIEIQLRSGLQHAWAAAVETFDFLLGEKIKTGGGSDDWKTFFRLSSSAIALTENSPLVPNTPTDKAKLTGELRRISEKVRAVQLLKSMHMIPYSAKNALSKQGGAAYLVILNTTEEKHTSSLRTVVKVYQANELSKANQDYLDFEKQFSGDDKRQVLLLSVEQVSQVEPAYPAYFLQAHRFAWTLEDFIKGNEENN